MYCLCKIFIAIVAINLARSDFEYSGDYFDDSSGDYSEACGNYIDHSFAWLLGKNVE